MGEKGFTILDMDEAFFVHDVVSGRKYWSPQGGRIVVPHTGSHKRIVVYGAIAKDSRQPFRTRELFDMPTLVWYLKELQRHFGKVGAVMDRASPHRAKAVKKLLRKNKTLKLSTFRKDPRTSMWLRNAGVRESRSVRIRILSDVC